MGSYRPYIPETKQIVIMHVDSNNNNNKNNNINEIFSKMKYFSDTTFFIKFETELTGFFTRYKQDIHQQAKCALSCVFTTRKLQALHLKNVIT